MIGKLFAATDKACGRCYNKDFKLVPNDDFENIMYKEYHGMASRDARKNILSYASVEGVAGMIKYSGTTEDFINDTKLRLQASLSYAGAKNWKEFRKNTYPVMRSNAGIIAADTHLDITLDK
jgi:IMP dehydrogenase/GMP reductase